MSAANQPRPDDGSSVVRAPTSYPGGSTPATAATHRRPPVRRAALVWVVSVLVIAVLGAPLGLLWRALAPSVPVMKTDGGPVLAQPEPEHFIAADGWFTLLGVGLGALVAVAIWFGLRRYRGPAGAVVVTVGMIGAAVLAWRLGREVGLSDYQQLLAAAPSGAHLEKPPDLRAGGVSWLAGVVPVLWGVLLAPAFGAAVMYTLLAAWSRYPDLQPEPEAVSWGWPGSPVPPGAPGPPGPPAEETPRG